MIFQDWIRLKWGDQGELAEKLKISRGTVSAYATGRINIPPATQEKLRKLGYVGAWPRDEAKESQSINALTREEFAEYRGMVKAEVSMLKEGLERAMEKIRQLESKTQDGGKS